MIDTITLTIPESEFAVIDHKRFVPTTTSLFSKLRTYKGPSKHIQNMKGGPSVTVYQAIRRGGPKVFMKIEVSLPKLIFGNNLEEINSSDFSNIIEKLQNCLKLMGIIIKDENLRKSNVTAIHYSKNIILNPGSTVSMINNEVSKLKFTKTADLVKVDYKNGGKALRYHHKNHEVLLYDKIDELSPVDKLRVKGYLNIFRIEVRILKRYKIKQICQKLSIKSEYTFQTLFDKDISKSIILYYWNYLTQNRGDLLYKDRSLIELLSSILKNNPNITYTRSLTALSYFSILKESSYIQLRNILQNNNNASRWYRLQKEMKLLKIPDDSMYSILKEVDNSFQEFKLLKYLDLFYPSQTPN